VNGGTNDFIVDRLKVTFSFKDDIRSVFELHKTPVIAIGKVPDNRTVLSDDFIQLSMKTLGIDVIGKLLSFIKIVNLHKYIVEHLEINVLLAKSRCQQVVPITVELQPERRPRWHSQITQPQVCGNEVEVIVQAFAWYCLEICFVSLFIMPGLISGAGFHRREDMYKSGMRTSLFDNIVNAVFFSKVLFADKIDFQAVFFSQLLSVETNLFPHGLNEIGVIKYSDAFFEEKRGHTLGITNARYGSSQYDPVKAGDDAFDFSVVPLDKIYHRSDSPYQSFQFEGLSEKCRAA
jgi:hypothetical protein